MIFDIKDLITKTIEESGECYPFFEKYLKGYTSTSFEINKDVGMGWETKDLYYVGTRTRYRGYSSNNLEIKFEGIPLTNNKFSIGLIRVEETDKLILTYGVSDNDVYPIVDASKFGLDKLYPTKKNPNRTELQKIIEQQLKNKETFDYFIHKDLKSFLNKELDVYIKNNLLKDILSSNNSEELIRKAKTFKDVATPIIDFLSQLEEFQKALWLKKKFIYDSNYCMTLDKIDSKHYDKILTCKAQLDEWTKLFGVEVSTKEDLTPYLILDTKFFSKEFKYTLLSEIANLDANTDGLLINSENFGALNLLQERYKEKIDVIYIDPPYNTKKNDFAYKDGYKGSSWLSFLNDRVLLSYALSNNKSTFFSNIDENELYDYHRLLISIYGENNFIADWIWQNKKGGGNDSKFVAVEHEYIKCFAKDEPSTGKFFQPYTEEYLKRYKEEDDIGKFYWDTFKRKSGKQYYPITCPDDTVVEYDELGNAISWLRSEARFLSDLKEGEVKFEKKIDGWSILFKQRLPEGKKPRTILTGHGTTSTGNDTLLALFGNLPFSNPKPQVLVEEFLSYPSDSTIILDYFAGSGTTGHAVININRIDNKKRKYILVEMGEYFDTATKPRIQKVIYTNNWKDGKPQDTNGISQIFKYFSLESYEDTLNNLEFKQKGILPEFEDEYLINYMLLNETPKYNLAMFEKPFEYKLNIAKNNEAVETNIDLVETFNYLLGLHVSSIKMKESYLIVKGTAKEEAVTVIWRKDTSVELKLDGDVLEGVVYINGDTNVDGALSIESEFLNKL